MAGLIEEGQVTRRILVSGRRQGVVEAGGRMGM